MKKRLFPYGISLIMVGLIMGFVLSGALDFTKPVKAEEKAALSENQDQSDKKKEVIQALDQMSEVFADVAEEVTPTVVTIFTEQKVKVKNPFGDFPFGEFFGFPSPQQQEREYTQHGLGSGVIVREDGYILTNNHVVQNADEIKVRLYNKKEYEAKVIGRDPHSDLAVIKIEEDGLRAISLGNSDKVRVGQWVLAIGSPLSQNLQHTVTAGIISAKGRSNVGIVDYEDFLQTDAAINPGNSGGPLVNLNGELIGINTAIASRTGGYMGIGFAIPVNLAKRVMNDIIEHGKVSRGYLGVLIQDVNPDFAKAMGLKDAKGAIITKVEKDSPAEEGGLKVDDIVIRIDDKDIENSSDLKNYVGLTKPGTTVKMVVIREGKEKALKVKIGEFPESKELAAKEAESETIQKVGLSVKEITPELRRKYSIPEEVETGVVVVGIDPTSVTARIGVQVGDVITKINRTRIKSVEDYKKVFEELEPGDSVALFISRKDARFYASFQIPKK